MAGRDPQSDVGTARRSDPVVEAYKKDIDRTLIHENLKLTPEQRIVQLMKLQAFAEELQASGRRVRRR